MSVYNYKEIFIRSVEGDNHYELKRLFHDVVELECEVEDAEDAFDLCSRISAEINADTTVDVYDDRQDRTILLATENYCSSKINKYYLVVYKTIRR